jgi:hypothetical protein
MKFALRCLATIAGLMMPVASYAAVTSFVGPFNTVSSLGSTVPSNGDLNPYGMVVVPSSTGALVKGNILISNFNNGTSPNGQQGTGSTIVQMTPGGANTLFAHIATDAKCTGGIGLTTALAIIQQKFVVVGSLPTSDGTSATAAAGCLIVLDNMGKVIDTITSGVNGPWDMTAVDKDNKSSLFFTNVLNGTVAGNGNVVNRGTVMRIDLEFSSNGMPHQKSRMMIGSGFPERTDAAALVVGPTGLGLGADGTLYVADTLASRIAAIPHAMTRENSAGLGKTVAQGGFLNQPLGLAIAPNGDILTVNAADGNLVDTSTVGAQLSVKNLDTTSTPPADPGAGTLFGLAVVPDGSGVYFVDDGTNTLNLLN